MHASPSSEVTTVTCARTYVLCTLLSGLAYAHNNSRPYPDLWAVMFGGL